jgi:nicotinamidase-related amidase
MAAQWRQDILDLPDLSPATFEFERESTALVLVDLQYVDAHRDHGWGPMLRERHPRVWSAYFDAVEQRVIPSCRRLLEGFRAAQARVIHVTLAPELPAASDMSSLRRPAPDAGGMTALARHRGSFAAQILPDVAPQAGELVINKTSRGAFNSTALERVLRNMEIRSVVVAGVTASSCVETTARDAADRGFFTVIVEDATAELDEASFQSTMRQFAHRWGRVWTTDQVLRELSG